MNRLASSRLFLQNNRKLFQALVARYSVDTGSKDYIDGLVKDSKVVVFMKGTADQPRCGFSNAVVQILNFHGVNNFTDHNVLDDETLRQGVKDYSNWPTIPQVYIGGEFIGGCDVMLEMHKNGELIEELKKVGIRSVLLDKIEEENKDK
ncbi:glutaredoxin-related protein 5, mitochondrial-like [Mercenaria mercenaria]|uniref:glutaredoxin-related protein 5, mitochondrial-like n=1 Tax=Mercenaria mercenaria TaxID=6596 RepID=UPI001E1D98AB|nr:glutaredoxin-related protein 5, mitochondrial-like [Mercenaria mercenaria]